MKKLFYLLIGILLILPNTIKADMSSPTVIRYKASVTNPNGIDEYKLDENGDYVKTGKKIPYGTIYELESDEFVCAYEDKCDTYVNPKDLTAVEKEYKVNKDKLGQFIEAIAYKDLDIKKGPATAYESTGTTIKAGTKISIAKIDESDEFNPWYYIEYNGIKGYVDSYSETILFAFHEKELLSSFELNILDPNTKSTLKTIKPTTKFTAKHGHFDAWSRYEYIEYDGVKGLIDKEKVIQKSKPSEIRILDEIEVIDESIYADYTTLTTLKKDSTFTSEYIYSDVSGAIYIYYEKDNIKGFAFTNNYETNDDQTIYTLDKYKEYTTNPKIDEEEKEETNKDDKEEETNKDVKKEENVIKAKKDYTLYICIGAGILIAITAIVTILLINQKKKEPEL